MRVPLILVFLFVFSVSWSVERPDSTKAKLKTGLTFSLNSNGIASIPAFSLDEPAIMAAVSLAKGRFSYEPTLAYGFDLKPWIIDNWLHYKIINRPSFILRTGMDVSMFFSDYKVPDTLMLRGQRYFTFELMGAYMFSPTTSLSLSYWNDRGQDKGTLIGHFISLAGEKSEIGIGKNVLLSAGLQVFYIDYNGNNDGLFISPKMGSSIRNVPFSLFFQGTQTIISNISPYPGFRWNLGLAYTL